MSFVWAFWYGWIDISNAYGRRNLWWSLAKEDITDLFRKTLLGPVWILLSFFIFIVAIFVVIQERDTSFLAYIALGFLVWNFISEVLSQSPHLLFQEAAFVRGTTLPLSIYAFRLTGRSTIRLGYSLIPALAIVFYAITVPMPVALAAVPGLALIVVTAPAVVLLLAILGVLLPDIEYVIQNAVRILFFLSPIFWHPGGDGLRSLLYDINPITYYIEIVREPFVLAVFPVHHWLVALAITAGLWVSALYLLGRFRDRIVFLV